DARHRADLRADRLDHDFARADDGVDANRGTQGAGAGEQQRQLDFVQGMVRHQGEQLGKMVDALLLAAVFERRVRFGHTYSEFDRRNACHTLHRGHRDGEVRLADAYQDGLGHRERERQTQYEGGALALLRIDRERTAELLDLVGDHVHADTATGQLRNFAGGGEAGLGDQLQDLVVARVGFGAQQATLHTTFANGLAIQATAVVGYAHHHLGGFARDADAYRALFRLACLAAFGR